MIMEIHKHEVIITERQNDFLGHSVPPLFVLFIAVTWNFPPENLYTDKHIENSDIPSGKIISAGIKKVFKTNIAFSVAKK